MHQLEKAERVAERSDAAHFIRIDRADRHRVDAKSVSTGEDQHLSFVVELARSAQEMWNKPSMQHPEPALGVGNVLTADVADLIAHVTIDRASKKRHPTRIAHASAYEKCGITSGGRV